MSSTPSVQLQDQARQIGQQITATERGFLPVEHILGDPAQLRSDYEKLRLSHELSREIAAERDTEQLLRKILLSMLKFTKADRGVIFLANERGEFEPRSWEWRDGRNEPLRVSSTILNHVVEKQAAVLTSDAANFDKNRKNDSVILNRIGSAIVAPLLHHNEVLGVAWLDSETLGQFKPKDLEIVVAICAQAAMFIEIAALGRKVQNEVLTRERFSRLLSPNIAELVVRGQLEVKQGGTLVEATVFNSDIRGFTGMSEGKDPQVLVEMLNQYFERMVDTVFKFEGTLDKFMGDGIMAIWGAPVSHRDDPIRAVQSALAMGEVLGRFNRERMAARHDPLAVGIGIHTGPVVAGYIGSSKALSFTVIGDVANTSARICGIALAGQVVVSETTRDRLGTRFELEELPPARLKGKEHPVRIFNVLRERPSVQVPAAIGSGTAGASA
jgi:adenylate cyclase